ncbi:MAG: T6SS effector amidase Tae4 family protein [Telluria sp.]
MKPKFQAVAAAYPSKIPYDRATLFQLVGWDHLITNDTYANTCAIRVSVGLAGAGMSIPGRMKINKGPHKGKLVEPGQARLSTPLARKSMLGAPEKFKGGRGAAKGIGTRSGVVSFWRIHSALVGDNQGHIDLVSPGDRSFLACRGCRCGPALTGRFPKRPESDQKAKSPRT